jgi:hypothetical protein
LTAIASHHFPANDAAVANAKMVFFDQTELARLLPMYRKDAIFARQAMLCGDTLTVVFNTFDHPFSQPLPKHLTREHALVFVTQASYLLASFLQRIDPSWPLTIEEFQQLALAEQATFTRVELKFHKFILNRDGIELNIHLAKCVKRGSRLYGRFVFDFPNGCTGECDAVLVMDGSLSPGVSVNQD